jgi:hypothetical protein
VITDPETDERYGVPVDSKAKGVPGWTDFGCPRCGNPEFSLAASRGEQEPPAKKTTAVERQFSLWGD